MSLDHRDNSYTSCLSDLPKLNLQIDKGTDFTTRSLQRKPYSSLSALAKYKQVEALSLYRENLGFTASAKEKERNDSYNSN